VSRRIRRSQQTATVATEPVVHQRRDPTWFRPAILALAAVCLIGLFSTEVADYDTWWHLKTGDYIVHFRSLPVPDPFSCTSNLGEPAYPDEEQVPNFTLLHD
jgi:hypothetical protein